MSNRRYYAPVEQYRDGVQSAYDAGLSYFPDSPFMTATPMGDIVTDLAIAGGSVLGGPAGGAAAGTASNVIQSWLGGTAVDQARQARVNYFADLAARGNVAAAQLILGAIPNVSGNERGMWQTAQQLVTQYAPDVMAEAQQLGPIVLLNNGDTAQNYPGMRRVTAAWAAQNPITSAIGSVEGAIGDFFAPSTPGQPGAASKALAPVGLLVGAVVLAAVLSSRRRRS